eukprot:1162147-Pelagomonas_calceolata.AAC.2
MKAQWRAGSNVCDNVQEKEQAGGKWIGGMQGVPCVHSGQKQTWTVLRRAHLDLKAFQAKGYLVVSKTCVHRSVLT